MSLLVRAPMVADADALGAVHVRAWQAAYCGGLMPDGYLASLSIDERASMWCGALRRAPAARSSRFVVTTDDAVIGFALVGPVDRDEASEVGELYAINIDPDHWGTGAGTALISAGEAALQDAGFSKAVLWVHPDNGRACRFYTARGWSRDNVDRRQDVLGVAVVETRFSRTLTASRQSGSPASSRSSAGSAASIASTSASSRHTI